MTGDLSVAEGKVLQKQRLRRTEIVVAAQKCFAEKGLHGASVADIARRAGLSVGQLYRVFASKEEIIEVIVSEIVNARVGEMVAGNHDLARMASVLAGAIPASENTKNDNYLLMEINAEASRNPRLREIMNQADRRLKEEGGKLTRHYHPEMTAEQISVACEFIAILTEGAAYRCDLATAPTVDKAAIEMLYRDVFNLVFTRK
ncbi:TetR family transcriptional regulator [Klebsiella oxytoca MGH 28]|nr:TetR/AcrR family transcriptional regulator [Klebsiella oxytoca]ESN00117.1 TetR family transcriptional regulator [Klebsiella oxytoca MGH 28]